MNTITIPEFCLVLLVGPSGSGKSTFARKHFLPTEIVSSDACRGAVADDENDQSATKEAFELLHFIVGQRLKGRRLTVVDATNVRPEDRAALVNLAKSYHALTAAFVFLLPETVCRARNAERPDRQFGGHVVRNQLGHLKRGLRRMKNEGIRFQYRLSSVEEVDEIQIERQKLWTDKRDEPGPFDVIGDIHGCADELEALLDKLGYQVARSGDSYDVTPPEGRRAIFVGDLVDRGPRVPDVLRIAKSMVESGSALAVCGNHENKLVRALNGRKVTVNHGLAESLAQLDAESPEFREEMRAFMDGLISHFVLDDGKLVVAHAGITEDMQGRSSGAVRGFCLYGETTGETDEFGLPVRYNWAAEYRGSARVVYGHTPVPEAEWVNGTICIDTGCVFGGKLSALRYPEMELIDVAASQVYCEPVRPLKTEDVSSREIDTRLFLEDVTGKRIIATGFGRTVTVSAEHSAAALEAVSRFAVNPKWLIHLPPTMSPVETSQMEGYLERPEEAFAYFATAGISEIVCEEKHMGSRAIMVVCRTADVAARRFGVTNGERGMIYTRTGRRFFANRENEEQIIARTFAAAESSGLLDELQSDWLCLDAEIMPWSVKAQALLEHQYAPVGAAAEAALATANELAQSALARGVDLADFAGAISARKNAAGKYRSAYRPYVWPVAELDDMQIAPFHILASEGASHGDKSHRWHMERCQRLAEVDDSLFLATPYRVVPLGDTAACEQATRWWEELTSRGGEGIVVKPLEFIARGKRGIIQPAVKVRGKEYLRIIYGPDYDLPENLERLRRRGLGKKRSMALREFALGLAALQRFVDREPLRRVHECAVAVLAMESEPVDPRL